MDLQRAFLNLLVGRLVAVVAGEPDPVRMLVRGVATLSGVGIMIRAMLRACGSTGRPNSAL